MLQWKNRDVDFHVKYSLIDLFREWYDKIVSIVGLYFLVFFFFILFLKNTYNVMTCHELTGQSIRHQRISLNKRFVFEFINELFLCSACFCIKK